MPVEQLTAEDRESVAEALHAHIAAKRDAREPADLFERIIQPEIDVLERVLRKLEGTDA